MKMKDKNQEINIKLEDLIQCYLYLRPLLRDYFNGNIANSDLIAELKFIYNRWFKIRIE